MFKTVAYIFDTGCIIVLLYYSYLPVNKDDY